nr:nitrilase-related carbon-nitrogen hydrolase [Enterobacter cloacae complex sp.]
MTSKTPFCPGTEENPRSGCTGRACFPGSGCNHRAGLRAHSTGIRKRCRSHRISGSFRAQLSKLVRILWEGSLSRQFDKRLFLQSVEVPGTHINAIAEACGRGAINAVIGINERLPGTTGTMFNTQVHITRDGKIVGKHQKYVATTGERLVHGPGQTGHYNNFMTDFGPVSALICGKIQTRWPSTQPRLITFFRRYRLKMVLHAP